MDLINRTSNFLQKITLTLGSDWEVIGEENVPPMGSLIIVSNHQSNFDPTLLSVSIPRRTWFLAKHEIFSNPLSSWLLRQYGAHPLSRFGTDINAYRWALNQLSNDQAIVLFPEGTRSKGGMRKAQIGVTRLALKSQSLILPVGITGTENLGTWLRVLNPTGKLRVNIGPVFSIPSIEGTPSKEVLGSLTDMVMQRIAVLLPNNYQGVYRID